MEAVLFDLDGTLVDSLPGIEYSIDRAMADCGCPPRSCEVRPLVGPPLRTMLGQITGDASPEHLDALIAAFRRSYDSDGWQKTIFFEGAQDALHYLYNAGVWLFLVTNKPEDPARQILRRAGLESLFKEVVCRHSRTRQFGSKAEMVRYVLSTHHLSPGASLFVGDSPEDYEAAAAAGVPAVLVRHGYGFLSESATVPDCQWIGSLGELTQNFSVRRSG